MSSRNFLHNRKRRDSWWFLLTSTTAAAALSGNIGQTGERFLLFTYKPSQRCPRLGKVSKLTDRDRHDATLKVRRRLWFCFKYEDTSRLEPAVEMEGWKERTEIERKKERKERDSSCMGMKYIHWSSCEFFLHNTLHCYFYINH